MRLHQIVACGITQSRTAGRLSDVDPENYTMLFTVNGNGWLDLPRPRQKLATGTVCVLPKGQAYAIKAHSHVLWFRFEPKSEWTWLMPTIALIAPASLINELKTLTNEFLREGVNAEQSRLAEGYMRLIALFLRRELLNLGTLPDWEHLQQLENLWKKVSENPALDWSIEGMASASNYSRSHFHATVQRLYGCGAMEIVSRLRMKRAMDLIQNRAVKIATAAESVGYVSPYSFSRAFKRIIGITPENYRRSIFNQ